MFSTQSRVTAVRVTAVVIALLAGLSGAARAATPVELRAQTGLPRLEPNRAALSQPIAGEKLVVAHYMTGMLPTPGAETDRYMNPALYDPNGRTAAIGGEYQTIPVRMLLEPALLPPEEAAHFEMRTAKKLGVDGFNFYYPLGPDDAFRARYDGFILAFFDAARKHNLDFKLTLCFSPMDGGRMSTAEKIRSFSQRVARLTEQTRGSDHWLRTPDGRVLFYTWVADGLAEEWLGGKQWEIRQHPELLEGLASAFDQIAHRADVPAAFMYHLQFPEDSAFVEKALDYFPAVTGWCSVEDLDHWRRVGQRCRERGRAYVQEVHGDYYTSKVYPRGQWDLVHSVDRVLELGIDGIERHAQVVGLTQTFRDKLQMAVDLDTPLINLTTWNDFPEGHHLAPEINHNFGFSALLRHYRAAWRNEPQEAPRDVAAVFFKKYPADAKPSPFDLHLKNKLQVGEPSADDGIEVVTMLTAAGELRVNGGETRPVPAGLAVTRVPMTPGPVRVEVTRGGRVVAELETPEWITLQPYRTDRLTYSYTTDHIQTYRDIFGADAPIHTSMEYAEDAQGVPHWKRGVRTELHVAND